MWEVSESDHRPADGQSLQGLALLPEKPDGARGGRLPAVYAEPRMGGQMCIRDRDVKACAYMLSEILDGRIEGEMGAAWEALKWLERCV